MLKLLIILIGLLSLQVNSKSGLLEGKWDCYEFASYPVKTIEGNTFWDFDSSEPKYSVLSKFTVTVNQQVYAYLEMTQVFTYKLQGTKFTTWLESSEILYKDDKHDFFNEELIAAFEDKTQVNNIQIDYVNAQKIQITQEGGGDPFMCTISDG